MDQEESSSAPRHLYLAKLLVHMGASVNYRVPAVSRGVWFSIKPPSLTCRDSHYKDMTVVRPFFLCNHKWEFLYWLRHLYIESAIRIQLVSLSFETCEIRNSVLLDLRSRKLFKTRIDHLDGAGFHGKCPAKCQMQIKVALVLRTCDMG